MSSSTPGVDVAQRWRVRPSVGVAAVVFATFVGMIVLVVTDRRRPAQEALTPA